jgi:hypothetical protein
MGFFFSAKLFSPAAYLVVNKIFYMPFHAAEQHSNERISDSAERKRLSDVARSLCAAQGSSASRNQVIGCTFVVSILVNRWFVSLTNKLLTVWGKIGMYIYSPNFMFMLPNSWFVF